MVAHAYYKILMYSIDLFIIMTVIYANWETAYKYTALEIYIYFMKRAYLEVVTYYFRYVYIYIATKLIS